VVDSGFCAAQRRTLEPQKPKVGWHLHHPVSVERVIDAIGLSNRQRSTDDSKLFQRSKNIPRTPSVPFIIVHPSDARERL
jgi:hypothetical protein